MEPVNKTLYIPLRGKAYVSGKGIILQDPKAEEIWASVAFPLKRTSRSRWLAYYMGMRAAVFDRWLKQKMEADPSAVVIHIGCGMDSRCERVGTLGHRWFDVDFPEVIRERKGFYQENDYYQMLGTDVTDPDWLAALPGGNAIVVMEGVSMYLPPEELKGMWERMQSHFQQVSMLTDCYTTFAARASKYKNPINDVGVTQVYGMDDPNMLRGFVRGLEMTPDDLRGMERSVFRTLYAGSISRKMYRLYEYGK